MPKAFGDGPPAASGAPAGADKGKILRECPVLLGWLCDASYDNGEPVGKTKLSMYREGTVVVAELKVQDGGGVKLVVRERNPDRALAALEALLGTDPTPWQPDEYPVGGKAKKRK